MSKPELYKQSAQSTLRPTGLGFTFEEFRLWRLMGGRMTRETLKKRVSALEVIARFYEVDTTKEGWLTEIMFMLALEHPHVVGKRKRAKGRPRSIEKFANDRSFLKFVFKLKSMLSEAQGRRVSFRHVALKLAVLEIVGRDQTSVLEAMKSTEAEDKARKLEKRIVELRKLHPDIEADSLKIPHLPGRDNSASE